MAAAATTWIVHVFLSKFHLTVSLGQFYLSFGESPTSILSNQTATMPQPLSPSDARFMAEAFAQAREALADREVPIGCVIVRNGTVVARGYNATNAQHNASRHAELVAIDRLLSLLPSGATGRPVDALLEGCTLYVTVEPCIMCASALTLLGLTRCVYGAGNAKFGGCGSVIDVSCLGLCPCPHSAPQTSLFAPPAAIDPADPTPTAVDASSTFVAPMKVVVAADFADEAVQLLQQFYFRENPEAPVPKVRGREARHGARSFTQGQGQDPASREEQPLNA
jgi:tRNA(Arg) A34 adenosine deaminase TadA